MHRLLTFAAVLLFANSAWALSCAEPEPAWWPGVAALSPQPFIVLSEVRADSAWFESGKTRIEAVITAVDRHQLIRPNTPLVVGKTYTLRGKGPYVFAKGLWRPGTKKRAPVTWTVGPDKSAAPVWTGEIEVGKSVARKGVWGTTSRQVLMLSYRSAREALAEIKLTRGKTTRTLYLPVKEDKPISFGRGLCDGAVQLVGEGDWTATITLVGPSGQRSAPKSVTFPSPVPVNR